MGPLKTLMLFTTILVLSISASTEQHVVEWDSTREFGQFRRVVLVSGDYGSRGTGFIIGKYLLTAAHNVREKPDKKPEPVHYWHETLGLPHISALSKDEYKALPILKPVRIEGPPEVSGDSPDLALYEAPWEQSPVSWSSPVLDEEVIIIGYGAGYRTIIHGRVARLTESQLFVDARAIRGFSGGPIFNLRGQVVGIFVACFADIMQVPQFLPDGSHFIDSMVIGSYFIGLRPHVIREYLPEIF